MSARLRAALAAALAAGLLAAFAAPAAAGAVDIRKVDVAGYPTVSVTVSVPGARSLGTSDVRVTENASAVQVQGVEPLAEGGRRVDVVLVMDTSGSMAGAPLVSAVRAASAFVRGLPAGVRVGLLAFSDRARPLVAPTADHAKVLAGLRGLRAGGETALFDAVVAAAGMLRGVAQADVVLLSDGGDTVSRAGARQAAAAVQASHATVFAVGLRTAETDVAALQTLASLTAGRYEPAATADLAALYGGLARVISDQYVITFRSSLARGSQDTIAITVNGASDVATVWLPGTSRAAAPVPAEPLAPPLLRDTWGLAVALALAFLAAFVLAASVLGSVVRVRRRRDLGRRMGPASAAGAVTGPSHAGADPAAAAIPAGGPAALVPGALARAAERVAVAGGFAPKLERLLERADVPMRPGELVGLGVLAAVAGLLVGALARNVLVGLGLAVVLPLLPRTWLSARVARRAARLHAQLPDTLMVLASALRAGHSFLQALDMVAKEIGDPGAKEFGRVVAEIRLGRPVDEAMNAMSERVGDPDFGWAVLAVNVQREVGGNLAEILESVAATVRERDAVRRQVHALSAEGRLSVRILIAIPLLMAGYMSVVNPAYIAELVSGPIGITMIVAAAVLMVIGLVWMRRVVRIDV